MDLTLLNIVSYAFLCLEFYVVNLKMVKILTKNDMIWGIIHFCGLNRVGFIRWCISRVTNLEYWAIVRLDGGHTTNNRTRSSSLS